MRDALLRLAWEMENHKIHPNDVPERLKRLASLDSRPPLTKQQDKVLRVVSVLSTRNGISPTYQEVADVLGYASLGTVSEHIKALVSKGYLAQDFNVQRSLKVLSPPGPEFHPANRVDD